jgi:hypothetical protein
LGFQSGGACEQCKRAQHTYAVGVSHLEINTARFGVCGRIFSRGFTRMNADLNLRTSAFIRDLFSERIKRATCADVDVTVGDCRRRVALVV